MNDAMYIASRIASANRLAGWPAPVRLSALLPTMNAAGKRLDGVATQRFRKDMIQVGEYRHPIDGYRFSVTQEKLRVLAATFHAMQSNGVAVEVVKDHSQRAEDVVGYLVDVFVEGDRLIGIHEMVGTSAIELVQRVRNVSLMIEPDVSDGRGNRYGEAIVHSAIVQRPVVPGQWPFAIAASASRSRAVDDSGGQGAAYIQERRSTVQRFFQGV